MKAGRCNGVFTLWLFLSNVEEVLISEQCVRACVCKYALKIRKIREDEKKTEIRKRKKNKEIDR